MADGETETLDPARASVSRSDLPLAVKLERAREELLDLSARNRLLSIPRSVKSAKTLEIVDEASREVFRMLAREAKAFTFLPGRAAAEAAATEGEEKDEIAELAQPDDDGVDARGVFLRHADTPLQTRLTPAGLQKRLLELHNDARTLEEEQGVNILFLALGTLKWIGAAGAVRHAPLILVPVALERGNAAEKFKLRARPEEVAANLSLEAFLQREHGLKLPTFEAGDDFDPTAYAAAVSEAVAAKPDWEVAPDDIVLGFFSFAKFLMYRDLDPEVWPAGAKLDAHGLIRPLVCDGFEEGEPLLPEDVAVDAHIAPADMIHIVDSDSSQTLAVHEVRRGRNLVIQGPPGTGKSQTIANIVASAVADGKTVLFVAEKMAALEVVKRRLDSAGVGDACLELHSNKANKRAVLEELRRTWELGAPRGGDVTATAARLEEARDALNAHAERLHAPSGAAGFTPYEVIGHLTRLRAAGQKPAELALSGIAGWSAPAFADRSALVTELAERVEGLGTPLRHVWRGVDPPAALPADLDRLKARLVRLGERLQSLRGAQTDIATMLEEPAPHTLAGSDAHQALAARVAGAPNLPAEALGAAVWDTDGGAIDALLRTGARQAKLAAELTGVFRPQAWSTELVELRETLASLPATFPAAGFGRAEQVAARVPELEAAAGRLTAALGRPAPPTNLRGVDELTRVAERVAAAPEADAQAFAAELWDSGVERAADLAAAVATLEAARVEVGSGLSEAAWTADLAGARRALAAQGDGLMRIFSGEWRAADRLARSFQSDPKARLERRLALLDALARGQAAAAAVREDGEFGRSAFGADWRGERSASTPLFALVEWMRSLRGFGAEPRLIASRHPDRRRVGDLAQQVAKLVEGVRFELVGLWDDVAGARDVVFGAAMEPEGADLAIAAACAGRLRDAHVAAGALEEALELDLERRRGRLAQLAEGQAMRAELAASQELGAAAFGERWRGDQSDWAALSAAAGWIIANPRIHALAARVGDRAALAARADAAVTARETLLDDLGGLLADLQAGPEAAITPASALDGPAAALAEALAAWREGDEALTRWTDYRARVRSAEALGLADLAARLHSGALAPPAALPEFEQAVFEAVFAEQVRAQPEMAQFDGDLHDRLVRRFGDLDRERIRLAALEVVKRHHATIPSQRGALGPVGVLKGEIAKRRGHLPIRRLMDGAAPAVQALKPVFMMSPLSVTQYLPPGGLTFDLLVMDEASQIQQVDALGAIARCRQVVVVGDPQQLPPTAFFAKMTGASDEEDDGGTKVGDIESILGLFTARGLPTRMLRWQAWCAGSSTPVC